MVQLSKLNKIFRGGRRFKAFTISEIMLTLVIIGVVSTVSIGVLNFSKNSGGFNHKNLALGLQSQVVKLNRAYKVALAEADDLDRWAYTKNPGTNTASVEKMSTTANKNALFIHVLSTYSGDNIVKNCGTSASCFPQKTGVVGSETQKSYEMDTGYSKFLTKDGASVAVKITDIKCRSSRGLDVGVCGEIIVDVNGNKAPNMIYPQDSSTASGDVKIPNRGVDTFTLGIFHNGVRAFKGSVESEIIATGDIPTDPTGGGSVLSCQKTEGNKTIYGKLCGSCTVGRKSVVVCDYSETGNSCPSLMKQSVCGNYCCEQDASSSCSKTCTSTAADTCSIGTKTTCADLINSNSFTWSGSADFLNGACVNPKDSCKSPKYWDSNKCVCWKDKQQMCETIQKIYNPSTGECMDPVTYCTTSTSDGGLGGWYYTNGACCTATSAVGNRTKDCCNAFATRYTTTDTEDRSWWSGKACCSNNNTKACCEASGNGHAAGYWSGGKCWANAQTKCEDPTGDNGIWIPSKNECCKTRLVDNVANPTVCYASKKEQCEKLTKGWWHESSSVCCTNTTTGDCCTAKGYLWVADKNKCFKHAQEYCVTSVANDGQGGWWLQSTSTCCLPEQINTQACCNGKDKNHWWGGTTCCTNNATAECCKSSQNGHTVGYWNTALNTCFTNVGAFCLSPAGLGGWAWNQDNATCCTDVSKATLTNDSGYSPITHKNQSNNSSEFCCTNESPLGGHSNFVWAANNYAGNGGYCWNSIAAMCHSTTGNATDFGSGGWAFDSDNNACCTKQASAVTSVKYKGDIAVTGAGGDVPENVTLAVANKNDSNNSTKYCCTNTSTKGGHTRKLWIDNNYANLKGYCWDTEANLCHQQTGQSEDHGMGGWAYDDTAHACCTNTTYMQSFYTSMDLSVGTTRRNDSTSSSKNCCINPSSKGGHTNFIWTDNNYAGKGGRCWNSEMQICTASGNDKGMGGWYFDFNSGACCTTATTTAQTIYNKSTTASTIPVAGDIGATAKPCCVQAPDAHENHYWTDNNYAGNGGYCWSDLAEVCMGETGDAVDHGMGGWHYYETPDSFVCCTKAMSPMSTMTVTTGPTSTASIMVRDDATLSTKNCCLASTAVAGHNNIWTDNNVSGAGGRCWPSIATLCTTQKASKGMGGWLYDTETATCCTNDTYVQSVYNGNPLTPVGLARHGDQGVDTTKRCCVLGSGHTNKTFANDRCWQNWQAYCLADLGAGDAGGGAGGFHAYTTTDSKKTCCVSGSYAATYTIYDASLISTNLYVTGPNGTKTCCHNQSGNHWYSAPEETGGVCCDSGGTSKSCCVSPENGHTPGVWSGDYESGTKTCCTDKKASSLCCKVINGGTGWLTGNAGSTCCTGESTEECCLSPNNPNNTAANPRYWANGKCWASWQTYCKATTANKGKNGYYAYLSGEKGICCNSTSNMEVIGGGGAKLDLGGGAVFVPSIEIQKYRVGTEFVMDEASSTLDGQCCHARGENYWFSQTRSVESGAVLNGVPQMMLLPAACCTEDDTRACCEADDGDRHPPKVWANGTCCTDPLSSNGCCKSLNNGWLIGTPGGADAVCCTNENSKECCLGANNPNNTAANPRYWANGRCWASWQNYCQATAANGGRDGYYTYSTGTNTGTCCNSDTLVSYGGGSMGYISLDGTLVEPEAEVQVGSVGTAFNMLYGSSILNESCCHGKGSNYWYANATISGSGGVSMQQQCCSSNDTKVCCESNVSGRHAAGSWAGDYVPLSSTCCFDQKASNDCCKAMNETANAWLSGNAGSTCCTSESSQACCVSTNNVNGAGSWSGNIVSGSTECCHSDTQSNNCCKTKHGHATYYWLGGSTCCNGANTKACCETPNNVNGYGKWSGTYVSGSNTCCYNETASNLCCKAYHYGSGWLVGNAGSTCCSSGESNKACCESPNNSSGAGVWSSTVVSGSSICCHNQTESATCCKAMTGNVNAFLETGAGSSCCANDKVSQACCESPNNPNIEGGGHYYPSDVTSRILNDGTPVCCKNEKSSDACCKLEHDSADYELVSGVCKRATEPTVCDACGNTGYFCNGACHANKSDCQTVGGIGGGIWEGGGSWEGGGTGGGGLGGGDDIGEIGGGELVDPGLTLTCDAWSTKLVNLYQLMGIDDIYHPQVDPDLNYSACCFYRLTDAIQTSLSAAMEHYDAGDNTRCVLTLSTPSQISTDFSCYNRTQFNDAGFDLEELETSTVEIMSQLRINYPYDYFYIRLANNFLFGNQLCVTQWDEIYVPPFSNGLSSVPTSPMKKPIYSAYYSSPFGQSAHAGYLTHDSRITSLGPGGGGGGLVTVTPTYAWTEDPILPWTELPTRDTRTFTRLTDITFTGGGDELVTDVVYYEDFEDCTTPNVTINFARSEFGGIGLQTQVLKNGTDIGGSTSVKKGEYITVTLNADQSQGDAVLSEPYIANLVDPGVSLRPSEAAACAGQISCTLKIYTQKWADDSETIHVHSERAAEPDLYGPCGTCLKYHCDAYDCTPTKGNCGTFTSARWVQVGTAIPSTCSSGYVRVTGITGLLNAGAGNSQSKWDCCIRKPNDRCESFYSGASLGITCSTSPMGFPSFNNTWCGPQVAIESCGCKNYILLSGSISCETSNAGINNLPDLPVAYQENTGTQLVGVPVGTIYYDVNKSYFDPLNTSGATCSRKDYQPAVNNPGPGYVDCTKNKRVTVNFATDAYTSISPDTTRHIWKGGTFPVTATVTSGGSLYKVKWTIEGGCKLHTTEAGARNGTGAISPSTKRDSGETLYVGWDELGSSTCTLTASRTLADAGGGGGGGSPSYSLKVTYTRDGSSSNTATSATITGGAYTSKTLFGGENLTLQSGTSYTISGTVTGSFSLSCSNPTSITKSNCTRMGSASSNRYDYLYEFTAGTCSLAVCSQTNTSSGTTSFQCRMNTICTGGEYIDPTRPEEPWELR